MKTNLVAAAIGLAGVVSVASAHEPHGSTVAASSKAEAAYTELLVTGEKLGRSLQNTPASVAVTTAQSIEQQAMISAYDVMDRTPNVVTDGSRTTFSIRGVDAFNVSGAGEGALASLYLDGTAIPRLALASGPLDLFDVAQIEILRGPQSTLQGRNALAGAIIINTADPTFDWTGTARLRVTGRDDQRRFGIAFGGPVAQDQLAFRLAGEASRTSGLIRNSTSGSDGDPQRSRTFRGKLLLEPRAIPGLRLLGAILYDRHQRGTFYTELDPPYDPRARTTTSDIEDRKGVTSNIATLLVEQETGAETALKFITSYSRIRFRSLSDADRTSIPGQLSQIDDLTRSFQEEVRFTLRKSWIEGLLGAYYLGEHRSYAYSASQSLSLVSLGIARQLQAAGLAPATAAAVLNLYGGALPIRNALFQPRRTHNYAGFADLSFPFGHKLHLRFGLRYDLETRQQSAVQGVAIDQSLPDPETLPESALRPIVRQLNGLLVHLVEGANNAEPVQHARYRAWLPKLGISYDLAPNVTLSLTAQRGYRAGGSSFNEQRAESYEFAPEHSMTYEWALRSSWWGNRLAVNANVYRTDWNDQQVLIQLTPGALYDTRVVNAGRSRLQGFEIESHATVNRTLALYAGLGFGSARFRSSALAQGSPSESLDGKAFPHAPRWTLSAGATFSHPEGWFANVNANHRSAYYQNVLDESERDIAARTIVNAKLGWQGRHTGAFLTATNIFDVQKTNQFFVDVDGRKRGTLNEPRILGISLERRL